MALRLSALHLLIKQFNPELPREARLVNFRSGCVRVGVRSRIESQPLDQFPGGVYAVRVRIIYFTGGPGELLWLKA
jgi:hypothetical protein